MTLKRKNNHSNVVGDLKLVENEVLHYILCRKLTFQMIADFGSDLLET